MLVVLKKEEFLIGLGGSIIGSILWDAWPESKAFKLDFYKLTSPEEPEKSPLRFVEHYHWGLACLIGGNVFSQQAAVLYGVGTGLIMSEALGDKPFGIGKSQYEIDGNVTLGLILAGMFLVSLGAK